MSAAPRLAADVRFRDLAATDWAAAASLRDRVLACLPHPDDYVPHDEEDDFLQAHLGDAGVCLGIESEGVLVGFAALTLDPGRAHVDEELRAAIARRGPTCILAVTMLDPAFRGLGLHRRAIDLRLELVRRRGDGAAVAIAAPSNGASLSNLVRRGGVVERIVDFAGGRARYLVAFDHAHGPRSRSASSVQVAVAETDRVRALLDRGWVGEEVVFVGGRAHFRLAPGPGSAAR